MPQPVSYNPGTPVSGSIQENSISYVVDGQNRNYRGGFAQNYNAQKTRFGL